MQLCIAAHASAVRATMYRLKGAHPGGLQHCQAGIQLASCALQDSVQSSSRCSSEASQSGLDAARRCSKQTSSISHGAKSSAGSSHSNSRATRREAEERELDDSSAPQSAWHVRSHLAQLHISMAELRREAGDREGAGSCLQAAREACCEPAQGADDASEGFSIETAAVLYQEAAMRLEQQELVSPCLSIYPHNMQSSRCVIPCL